MRPRITNDGYALHILAMDGVGINFSKIVIGNGDAPAQYRSLHDLVNPLEEIQIDSLETQNEYANLTAIFTNINTQASFEWTEVGIFCTNPDSTVEEPLDDILYAYGHYQFDDDETEGAAFIPAHGAEAFEIKLMYKIYIGELEDITAAVSDSTEYATKLDMRNHVSESNPHNTTAADVGLGKVPNVETNNQTPTYDIPESIQELSSGEKLGVALGKIAKAVSGLILHLADSVKHITSAERESWNNKSDKDHKHKTTDITSGTLQIERGGTGKNSESTYNYDIAQRGAQAGLCSIYKGSRTGTGGYSYTISWPYSGTKITRDILAIIIVKEDPEGDEQGPNSSDTYEEGGGLFAIKGVTKHLKGGKISFNGNSVTITPKYSNAYHPNYVCNIQGHKYHYILLG